jgi:DNA-binding MarR family transcriptional regulator
VNVQRQVIVTDLANPSTVAGELRAAVSHLVRRMREQGTVDDLTRSQLAVLSRLERDAPLTASALARAEGIRPQSMSATIAALESAGYVSGAPDPDDGRRTLLFLTPPAKKRFAGGRLAREDWLVRAINTVLSDDEHEELSRLVTLLERLSHSP